MVDSGVQFYILTDFFIKKEVFISLTLVEDVFISLFIVGTLVFIIFKIIYMLHTILYIIFQD